MSLQLTLGQLEGRVPPVRHFLVSAMHGLLELVPQPPPGRETMPDVLYEPLPVVDNEAHQLGSYLPVPLFDDPATTPEPVAVAYVRDGAVQDRDAALILRAMTDGVTSVRHADRLAEARRWVDQALEIAREVQVTTGGDADARAAAYRRAADAIAAYLAIVPALDVDTTGEYVRRLVWVLVQAQEYSEAVAQADAWLRTVRLPHSTIHKIRILQQAARAAAREGSHEEYGNEEPTQG